MILSMRFLISIALILVATKVMGQVDEDHRAIVANLIRAVEEPTSHVGIAEAADQIHTVAARDLAVTRLSGILENGGDPVVQSRAAHALAQFPDQGEKVVPILIAALESDDETVRSGAAWALSDMGPAASPSVNALRTALQDEYGIREAALTALGRIGPPAKGAVPDLIRALNHKETVRTAIISLGQIGPAAASAVPDLIEHMENGPADVRGLATEALGDIGPKARAAISHLGDRGQDSDRLVVVCAAYALARIAPDTPTVGDVATSALADLITDEDFNTRNRVIVMLGKLGPVAAGAVPTLTASLEDPTIAIRVVGCEALGKMGGAAEHALPSLQLATESDNYYVRRAAKEAINRISGNP